MPDAEYAVRDDFAQKAAEDLIWEAPDGRMRDLTRSGKSRRDFAMIAAYIAEDRYAAGSTAAVVTVYLMLKYGREASVNFVEDLKHHES